MTKKKVLILTASPKRDILIDEMIATELNKLGNEAKVAPCLRKGREAVLDFKPNIVIVPPVRNMYSRDFCEELKRFGCAVISRHTEPSCDWADFKSMNERQKMEVLGNIPYYVDLEIVWSEDEKQILERRAVKFPIIAVGSFGVDKYKNEEFVKRFKNKKKFQKKHKLDNKPVILVQSPWGFADHAPDLKIDEIDEFRKDIEGRDRHLDMIEYLHNKFNKSYNILVTTHQGVITQPYLERLKKLKIPLDTESTSVELLINSDILIHAGSTMAIGAHFLKKPAFQFGDVNLKDGDNWWHQTGKIMAELSPYCKTKTQLCNYIKNAKLNASNISKKSLACLEKGRYGVMDGKAYTRAAKLIDKYDGKFAYKWPRSTRDYSQLTIVKHPSLVVANTVCGICKEQFGVITPKWLDMLKENIVKVVDKKTTEKIMKELEPQRGMFCPQCGSRFLPPSK